MPRWKLGPYLFDAVQFDCCSDSPTAGVHLWPDGQIPDDRSWGYVETKHGRIHVHHGDFILCRDGEFEVCKGALFIAAAERIDG